MSLALRGIEHLAYNYSVGTFLDGVSQAPPWQRVEVLAIAGVIGGAGWWALRRWGARVVSVQQVVAGTQMPPLSTVINDGLQVIIVGLGASIGREVAPRELGAAFAGWLGEKAGVTSRERRILIACGACAGLAAVYSVPLGGALFAVEGGRLAGRPGGGIRVRRGRVVSRIHDAGTAHGDRAAAGVHEPGPALLSWCQRCCALPGP